MIEKNRDILINALNGLPRRKAGEKGWEKVSGSLDHLDSKDFLAKNISSLPRYKASANAWKSIEKALPSSFFAGPLGSLIKAGSAIFIGAALITALIFLLPDQDDNHLVSRETGKRSNTKAIDKSNADRSEKTVMPNIKSGKRANAAEEIKKPVYPMESLTSSTSMEKDRDINMHANAKPIPVEQFRALHLHALTRKSNHISQLQNAGKRNQSLTALTFQERNNHERPEINYDYFQPKNHFDLSLGAFYSLINFQRVQVQNMEVPESVSSFGMDLMLESRNFYLKTGLAYLSWKEKAKYTFEYRQHELIYTYNYVDSAHINPGSGSIDYFTTKREVFDSLEHFSPGQIRYQYRVLQVPLIAGYKVLENQKLSFALQAGIGADFRIGGREYLPVFNKEDARVIDVVNYLDYRFNINWRMIGGLSVRYRISDRLSFYLEPTYHQYLKSIYQNSGLKNVSYIEFKGGIIYKF